MKKPDQFGMMFYKSTRPGIPGLYNRIVRAWDKGQYSHVEVTFSNGESASASMEDKGVRFKDIEYDPSRWDFVPLPPYLEAEAREYFVEHDGKKYDLQGNFHFVIGFIPDNPNRKFCSEAAVESIGLCEGWRYTPNNAYPVALAISEAYFGK